jgi:hypothetical protein
MPSWGYWPSYFIGQRKSLNPDSLQGVWKVPRKGRTAITWQRAKGVIGVVSPRSSQSPLWTWGHIHPALKIHREHLMMFRFSWSISSSWWKHSPHCKAYFCIRPAICGRTQGQLPTWLYLYWYVLKALHAFWLPIHGCRTLNTVWMGNL